MASYKNKNILNFSMKLLMVYHICMIKIYSIEI